MTPREPVVSVGLPVFNGARYLRSCIDSVLAQTYGDFELVVCDNASTDDSASIAREYAARDPRVRFSANARNIGGFRNQNRVFELARGRYFHWIGHDDLRAPDFLARAVARLDADPLAVVAYGRTRYIGESGEPLEVVEAALDASSDAPADRFGAMIRLDHKCEPVYGVIRAEVLRRTALQGQYADTDRVLAAELALHGRFVRVGETYIERRLHAGTSIGMYPARQDRRAWYEPGRPVATDFPYWRELAEFAAAVRRAAPTWRVRRECYRHLARWLVANRRALASDIHVAAFRMARRVRAGEATLSGIGS